MLTHDCRGPTTRRTRWPRPLAARKYVYARRVWPRAGDGGCYSVSRACGHRAAPQARGVPVRDFAAATLIRAARSCRGSAQGAPLQPILLLAKASSCRGHVKFSGVIVLQHPCCMAKP